MEPKLCKDCKHISLDDVADSLAICTAPSSQPAPDLVFGKPRQTFCDFQRSPAGKCGTQALFFLPMEKVPA